MITTTVVTLNQSYCYKATLHPHRPSISARTSFHLSQLLRPSTLVFVGPVIYAAFHPPSVDHGAVTFVDYARFAEFPIMCTFHASFPRNLAAGSGDADGILM